MFVFGRFLNSKSGNRKGSGTLKTYFCTHQFTQWGACLTKVGVIKG